MRGRVLFAYSLVLALTACGGGGGGGSGGGSPGAGAGGGGGGSSTPPPPPPQVPLVFSGVSTAASVSATNAGPIAANLMSAMGAAAGNSFGMQTSGGLTGVDATRTCDSGTMQVSGNLGSDGTGTLSINYNACRNAAHTLNGPATLQITAYDSTNKIITNGTVTMTRINVSGPGMNSDITGTVQRRINVSTNTETLTANIIAQDNSTGRMMRADNLVIVNGHLNVVTPTFYTQSITGTVVDSVAGSVTVSTSTPQYVAPWGPLYFATSKQPFPDWGVIDLAGVTIGTGAAARTPIIRISGLSAELAKIQVDVDGNLDPVTGNRTFEQTARLRWMDLNSPLAADLADNDGDGMHNSWETAHGLNPNDPSDKFGDFDGDGYTNWAEYLAGSDPSTNGSIPGSIRTTFFTGTSGIAAAGDTVYASVGANNIVVPFDAVAGEANPTAIAVGSNPKKLAASDDGSYLYVGLDGESTVQRINLTLPVKGVDLSIPLPGGRYVDDMQALPGAPASIAVSLQFHNSSPRFAGVAIYDGATPRSSMFLQSAGPNVLACSASNIYGYQSEGSPFGLYRMSVDATGIAAADSTAGLMAGAGGISFAGGLIYTTAGQQIDPGIMGVTPTPPTVVGTFAGVDAANVSSNLVVADASLGRVFYLTPSATPGIWTLSAYSTSTRALLASLPINNMTSAPSNLIRYGARGLAFRTEEGYVFLVESPDLIP